MNGSILVMYKSVTGFTERYARWIAEDLDCEAADIKDLSAEKLSGCETVIFGGRFHAGRVDGLKKAKELFEKSSCKNLILFATGATPNSAGAIIEEAWKNDLTPEELSLYPHFYMQSGLRYEKMSFGDRAMMKVFASMVKRKKDKTDYDKAMEKALGSSYDLSSREFISPLVSYVTARIL